MSKTTFDDFSESYEDALNAGISVSGEDSSFFARGRLESLAKLLQLRKIECKSVLDFGCGTGNSLPLLRELLGATRVSGVDVSAQSIATARGRFKDQGYELSTVDEMGDNSQFDLAFCNGVFHHIPVDQRLSSAQWILNHLVKGGHFAFFENNPLNPGTRYVMSRIAFDRDAITLLPWESRRLLRSAGFEILLTHYLFFFPKPLAWFRRVEPSLRHLGLGAQYLVLAQRCA